MPTHPKGTSHPVDLSVQLGKLLEEQQRQHQANTLPVTTQGW